MSTRLTLSKHSCVCNNGLTLGALAIMGDDTTGVAAKVLAYTVPNAAANCAFGPSPDGTWSETANYWFVVFPFAVSVGS